MRAAPGRANGVAVSQGLAFWWKEGCQPLSMERERLSRVPTALHVVLAAEESVLAAEESVLAAEESVLAARESVLARSWRCLAAAAAREACRAHRAGARRATSSSICRMLWCLALASTCS